MHTSIDEYWQRYAGIQDRLMTDPDNPSNIREVLLEMTHLAEEVEQESTSLQKIHMQLEQWLATFHRMRAELNLDLGLTSDAIGAYRKALEHSSDLEIRVGLIRALCTQGDIVSACSEINTLGRVSDSFTSTGDAESAVKVLQVLFAHAELIRDVDVGVLRDVLQAIAARGTFDVSLMTCP